MPNYSVEIALTDSDLLERAEDTIEKLAWTLNRLVDEDRRCGGSGSMASHPRWP
jgi:hypothetical protein